MKDKGRMVEKSILEQVYDDGKKEGYWSGKQLSVLSLEYSYDEGRRSVEIPKRWPVFFVGLAIGVVIGYWLW